MPPAGNGQSVADLIERLTKAVRAHTDAAPFTLQRLAELLLEPQKQYARLDKLVQSPSSHYPSFVSQEQYCAHGMVVNLSSHASLAGSNNNYVFKPVPRPETL